MSTPELKPSKKRSLNTKLLPIAAILLILLALLFMATPLLRQSRGFQETGGIIRQGNGQSFRPNATPGQGEAPQFLPGQGSGNQGQGFPGQNGSNATNRQFIRGIGFLSGRSGPIVYFVALLVALAAALGMFFIKRWGQILGIIMAVLYLLAGVLSLLPILLFGSFALRNPLSLVLGIVHVVLAIAVIVLVLIPAKKVVVPAEATPPPAANA
jgi:hypothetical protein